MPIVSIGPKVLSQPLNDNFADYVAHKAEKATATDDVHGLITEGRVIQETGASANGRYVKFADGTLICTIKRVGGLLAGGSVWTYPATFTNIPFLSGNDESATSAQYKVISFVAPSTTNTQFYPMTSFTTRTDTTGDIDLLAIGRWK